MAELIDKISTGMAKIAQSSLVEREHVDCYIVLVNTRLEQFTALPELLREFERLARTRLALLHQVRETLDAELRAAERVQAHILRGDRKACSVVW